MGNMQCPGNNASHLAAYARDFCPFPTYYPNPHFNNMLYTNGSDNLKQHYMTVQNSLDSKQRKDFTQRLRTTFGREGKVTHGGTGIVALSLAFLFDILAKQVKGESVPDSGLIPGLFLKEPSGYYPEKAHTVSSYLRLVPHIANNPTRMREETERYVSQLAAETKTWNGSSVIEDIRLINEMLAVIIEGSMQLHLIRLKNGSTDDLPTVESDKGTLNITYSFNCVPEEVNKEFLAKVQQADNRTKEAFNSCKSDADDEPVIWMRRAAELEFTDVVFVLIFLIKGSTSEEMITYREDFDLKANSLVKWAE